LLTRRSDRSGLDRLTDRERDVVGLTGEGLSFQAIGKRLFLSDSAVSRIHASLFAELGIGDDMDTNRRVLAVLVYLHQDR
jgi:DNA-binding NarL/FixJ family response regulator